MTGWGWEEGVSGPSAPSQAPPQLCLSSRKGEVNQVFCDRREKGPPGQPDPGQGARRGEGWSGLGTSRSQPALCTPVPTLPAPTSLMELGRSSCCLWVGEVHEFWLWV